MAKNSLDKRLSEIEGSFIGEQKIRFFIKNGDEYTCMQTRRKSDNINDLITGREDKNIVYDIKYPDDRNE